ncbi:ATPase [Mesorhizobium sp. NBSH29]|uniref:SRPBCC family protein n=1 Tax=Mesorhizobium sp. NBSH29 TaxID=2654249 RepID=UPI0018967426|nr:SRPBCC family protein [Mesorhizobium sp. NBSH29]QPC86439.1 ATPase [Mesorhizobium sp. NBSH29]
MTLQDGTGAFAELTGGSTMVIERWLPGPADRIWRYLTDSDLRRKWFAAGEMALVPGAPLNLVWHNDTLSDADDVRPAGFPEEQLMQSQVIAVDPMRMLKIAWGKGDVTFALKEKGDRVLLTVTHRGLDDQGAQTEIAGGWHMHLEILVATMSGTDRPSFWSGWTRLQVIYDDRLNNPDRE